MKYILFVGENTASTDDIKMCQAIQNKIRIRCLGRNRFCTQAWEKGAQWFAESKYDQGEKVLAHPAHLVDQKLLSSAF